MRDENSRMWEQLCSERRKVEKLVNVVGRLWDVVGKGFPGSGWFLSYASLEIWAEVIFTLDSTPIPFRPTGNGGEPQHLHHFAHRDLLALPTPTIHEHAPTYAQPQQPQLKPDRRGLSLLAWRPTPRAPPHAYTTLAVAAAQLPACEQLPRGKWVVFHAFAVVAWGVDLDHGPL